MAVGQPIDLFGGSTLLCALGGCTEGRDSQGVTIPALFGAEVVGEGIVERAFDDTFIGPAITNRACKSPSASHHTRTEGIDGTCLVVAVARRQGEFLSLGHVRGTQVDVVATTDAGHAKRVVLVARRAFLRPGQVVQTAQQAVVIAPQLQIVELQPVEERGGVHIVERTHPEAHRAPLEPHLRQVGVIVRRSDIRDSLGSINIIVELRLGEREVVAVILRRLRLGNLRAGNHLGRRLPHQSHHGKCPGRSCQCYNFAHDMFF